MASRRFRRRKSYANVNRDMKLRRVESAVEVEEEFVFSCDESNNVAPGAAAEAAAIQAGCRCESMLASAMLLILSKSGRDKEVDSDAVIDA